MVKHTQRIRRLFLTIYLSVFDHFVKHCKKHLSLKPAALDDEVNELKTRHHQSISCIRHAPKNIETEC